MKDKSEAFNMYREVLAVNADYQAFYKNAHVNSEELNNKDLRASYYEYKQYGLKSSWSTITINKTKYAIQPYYNEKAGTLSIVGTKDLISYKNGQVKEITQADALYDPHNDTWIEGTIDLKGKTITEIYKAVWNLFDFYYQFLYNLV